MARAGDDIGHHHVAVEAKRLKCDSANFRDAGEVFFHVGHIDFFGNRKDDEVGGIGDLGLVPGVRTQLRAELGIGDDKELPGLEAVGGR